MEVIAISFVDLSRRLLAIRSDDVVSIDRNSELFNIFSIITSRPAEQSTGRKGLKMKSGWVVILFVKCSV